MTCIFQSFFFFLILLLFVFNLESWSEMPKGNFCKYVFLYMFVCVCVYICMYICIYLFSLLWNNFIVFFLSAFAITYCRCGYAVEIYWQGSCTFCLRFAIFLAQWLQVFFVCRLREDILYETGFQVSFWINANPLKAFRNGWVLECFLKLGEVLRGQCLSLHGSGSDRGRSYLPAMAVFSPNCGRQLRVLCNWTWNWEDAGVVGTICWWCVVSKKVLLWSSYSVIW